MRFSLRFVFAAILFCSLLSLTGLPLHAQVKTGTITGTATSVDGSALPGAEVEVYPGDFSVKSNLQGQFTVTGVPAGTVTVTINYLGFSQFTKSVSVLGGQVAKVDAVLEVARVNDTVEVTAGRSSGEAEAINGIRTSDTIVNILPANVIISLPNANLADALGRLPGVTLERDEGEGKYVQIRGTEPRLSNLLIDGFNIPSPEGGVRQVKLDTIPSGLVQSVEINKTFQANMDGDAIGGSVSLVTKSAGERPTLEIFGAGGFTPIIHTVPVAEFGGTLGQRFGHDRKLGLLVSGSYDYNGRGIDDLEPQQTSVSSTDLTPSYLGAAIRTYKYNRTRYGFGASLDYKLNETSLIYAKFLFSDFMDFGYRYEYVIQTAESIAAGGPLPVITTERRIGDFQVANFILGGNHVFNKSWINWGVAVGHARMLNPLNGGEAITDFVPVAGFTTNCHYDPAATRNRYKPQFTQACFDEIYNPNNFQLDTVSQSGHGKADQLNIATGISVARNYHLGSHYSTFEVGFKFRNEHKFDNSYTNDYQHNSNIDGVTPPVLETQFLGGFTNPGYYGGAYKFAPNSPNWKLGNSYLAAHMGDFTLTSTKGGNANNFDLVEQITAGYLMNTIDFSRVRFIIGLRIEGTNDKTVSFNQDSGTLSLPGGGNYVSYLPSASLRFKLDSSSDIRVAFSRSLARPDPQYLTASFATDCGTQPCTVTEGNSTLRPEYSLNYDALYEHYFKTFGLFRGGFFYKQLSDPVVATQTEYNNQDPATSPCPKATPTFPNCFINIPSNAGSAHIAGLELDFLDHFTFLPGWLSGFGVSANYSYAASQAHNVSQNRTDSPALLRQAPNTWNISPTYDRGRLSVRLGLAYNQSNIYVYNYSGDPTGIHGPAGDQYLYSHFQVDLQGSYRIRRGLTFYASALNLNNEVFGFYYGSPQYVNQREYYRPTYSFGLRWEPFAGRK